MNAVNPVGATCATQRPVSSARSRDALICCVCRIVPLYDAPFVGFSSTVPPWPIASRARPPKNTSHEITTPRRPAGRVEHRRARRPATASRGTRSVGAPIASRTSAQRHPLAERDAPHLLVPRRSRRPSRRTRPASCGSGRSPSPSMTPTANVAPELNGRASASSAPSVVVADRALDVHHVLRPHHEVDGQRHVSRSPRGDARTRRARRCRSRGCLAVRRPARARCRACRCRWPRGATAAKPITIAIGGRADGHRASTPVPTPRRA